MIASAMDLEHTVKLVEPTGQRILARVADVRDQSALDAVVAEATEVFRTMQVLPTDWLEPRDVSEVIAFLASDAARFITGVALPVDAGQVGRG